MWNLLFQYKSLVDMITFESNEMKANKACVRNVFFGHINGIWNLISVDVSYLTIYRPPHLHWLYPLCRNVLQMNEVKYLGVTFSDDLQWSECIQG